MLAERRISSPQVSQLRELIKDAPYYKGGLLFVDIGQHADAATLKFRGSGIFLWISPPVR
jgi:hypothetical protein